MTKLSAINWLVLLLLITIKQVLAIENELPAVEVETENQKATTTNLNFTNLDRDYLTRSGQREVSQVIRGLPGITINQGMKGGPSDLSLRGASGGVGLVNIDGIPLHALIPGAINLDIFPAETFGSAELYRGSSAMLNFGRTLGGTLNLMSRQADTNEVLLHLEGGSFGALRETATVDLANAKHQLSVTAGGDDLFDGTHWADRRKGNSERDQFHDQQVALHLQNQLHSKLQLDSSIYYVNSLISIDKVGLLSNKPEFGIIDDNGRASQSIWLTQSKLKAELTPKWMSELQLGFTEQQVNILVGDIFPNSATYPIAFNSQLFLTRWKNSHSIISDKQKKSSLVFNWGGEGVSEQGQSNQQQGGQRGTGSGFITLEGKWHDLSGNFGVRGDHFDGYGNHTVYQADLNWQMTSAWHLFSNIGTGFRVPGYNELLMWPFANPQIKPEKSLGGDIGIRWSPDKNTDISVNYFHNKYSDLIKIIRSGPPFLGIYRLNNITHAETQGVELQGHRQWHQLYRSGLDFTWTSAYNIDDNTHLPRQPAYIGKFWSELTLSESNIKLWSQIIYRSDSYDTADTLKIPDAINLDLQLSYQINQPLMIYVRGENLTNNRNSQVYGWSMEGASIFGGFKWNII